MLLSHKNQMDIITVHYGSSTKGWDGSSLKTWLNTRMYKAISPLWKSLIQPVKVSANNGDYKTKDIVESSCYFYIPSVYEIASADTNGQNFNRNPYNQEISETIATMTSNDARKRAKVNTPEKYDTYYTRSANVDQSYVQQWIVNGSSDSSTYDPGSVNGFYYISSAGILLMFSICSEG